MLAARTSGAISERVVLLGAEGGFSRPLLECLLARGVALSALAMPAPAGPPAGLPLLAQQAVDPAGFAGLGAAHGLCAIRAAAANDPGFARALEALAPDVLLVGCFPWKLPPHIVRVPRLACWNLHPSLLPKYRGPVPMYWQLRNGEQHTGVTLHEVSGRIDAGAIVGQRPLPLPAARDPATLDAWVARHGAALFMETLDRLRCDRLLPRAQDEAEASYYPHPRARRERQRA